MMRNINDYGITTTEWLAEIHNIDQPDADCGSVEMKISYKITIPHIKGCPALNMVNTGRWDSPWYFTGNVQYRDKSARTMRGYTRWLVMLCNSTDCKGQMLVKEHDIVSLVPAEK